MKAIIFDLDDTLYDCTGSLLEASRKRAAKAMVNAGLPCTEEEAYLLQKKYQKFKVPIVLFSMKYQINLIWAMSLFALP